MSNVFELHKLSDPIHQYVRLGHTGHKHLQELHSAGQIQLDSLVFDASHIVGQEEVSKHFHGKGVEIILDPKTAEMEYPASVNTSVNNLPWAAKGTTQSFGDWQSQNRYEKSQKITEFVNSAGVDAVLSPSHLITQQNSPWLRSDVEHVHELREVFDQNGLGGVRIDYHLMTSLQVLGDADYMKVVVRLLNEAPIDNIWLRVGNFGMGGSVTATIHFIEACWALSELQKPIIADNVGGIAGLVLAGFGAAGGVSAGIGSKEKFSTSSWKKPTPRGQSFSPPKRVYVPQLDMYLRTEQVDTLLKTKNARGFVMCKDKHCCRDADDLFKSEKRHTLVQSLRQLKELEKVPNLRRPTHIVEQVIDSTNRDLRKVSRLKIEDPTLLKKVHKKSADIDRLQQALEKLISKNSDGMPKVKPPVTKSQNSQLGMEE